MCFLFMIGLLIKILNSDYDSYSSFEIKDEVQTLQ